MNATLHRLLASAPAEDLLALVWGPRIDRQQALALLARAPALTDDALAACLDAADRYDALPAARQQRLRGRLARGLVDNAACPASC